MSIQDQWILYGTRIFRRLSVVRVVVTDVVVVAGGDDLNNVIAATFNMTNGIASDGVVVNIVDHGCCWCACSGSCDHLICARCCIHHHRRRRRHLVVE